MNNTLDESTYGVEEITSEEVREINGGSKTVVVCVVLGCIFLAGVVAGYISAKADE